MDKIRGLKFKGKILLPTAVLFVLLLTIIIAFSIRRFNNFAEYLMQARIEAAAGGIRDVIEEYRMLTIDVGFRVGSDPRIIAGVLNEDTPELLRVGQQLADEHNFAYFSFMNRDAIALARTHQPQNYGDLIGTPSLRDATLGIISNAYGAQSQYLATVRSSVPIMHEGEIIGGIVSAISLDTDAFVDRIQRTFDAEVIAFVDGVSVASTFREPDGSRMIGTEMPRHIAEVVVGRQQEKFDTVEIYDEVFSAFYLPMIGSHGEMFGQLFIGLNNEGVIAERNTLALQVILLALFGAVIALFILFLISERLIKPINQLERLVKDVSTGNININIDRQNITQDEIGDLTLNILNLVDVIKGMTDDLVKVHYEYIKIGNIHYAIDESKYQNAYGEMIGLINNLMTAVTTDILDVADTLNHISDGDFEKSMNAEVWVGDWVAMPKAVNKLTSNLKAVSSEIGALIEAAAVKGDLNFEIDETKYKGDWCEIMMGLNAIAKAVYAPLKVIEIAMGEMQAGNFDLVSIDSKISANGVSPNSADYNGLFKDTLIAFDATVTDISSYIDELEKVLAQMADGDLRNKIEREYVGSFNLIKRSVNNISDTLNKTMSEISSSSEQVLSGAKQISISAQELANGAQEQASSVQELNAAIDMIGQQTRQNANSATEAKELSNISTANAKDGNASMNEMLSAMAQIKESSNDISKIIKVIQDIAFQTNLLALNAAVEAARAGEHGKGFSVVAEEVRSLAMRSQDSASETTGLIETSINRVESGSSIAESTSHTLDTIVKNAADVSEFISKISIASKEQTEAIAQVSEGLSQISRVTQNNAAVSQETAAASEELDSQAELLRQLVSYFKL
ncbi:MAG: methyl-accepting chemotaxis protein [Defluviitaleaceae bacterium]|nr:methyl-accepting chemotaxis protein [Defluviitaleaceae bacterium]